MCRFETHGSTSHRRAGPSSHTIQPNKASSNIGVIENETMYLFASASRFRFYKCVVYVSSSNLNTKNVLELIYQVSEQNYPTSKIFNINIYVSIFEFTKLECRSLDDAILVCKNILLGLIIRWLVVNPWLPHHSRHISQDFY